MIENDPEVAHAQQYVNNVRRAENMFRFSKRITCENNELLLIIV